MKPRLVKRPDAERQASRPAVERKESRYRAVDSTVAKLGTERTHTATACAVSETYGTVPAGSVERLRHTDVTASTEIKFVAPKDRQTGSCIDPGGFKDAAMARKVREWLRYEPIIRAINSTIGTDKGR